MSATRPPGHLVRPARRVCHSWVGLPHLAGREHHPACWVARRGFKRVVPRSCVFVRLRGMSEVGGVAVVGSINVDLTVFATPLPRPGETVIGDSFSMVLGGKGANQAV